MKKWWLLLPSIGIVVFIGLYLYAASLYSGGSVVDKNAIGFDWIHNYWCDLFDIKTHSGQPNQARPIAILAMPVLCFSYALLWFWLPRMYAYTNLRLRLIPILGTISMLLTAFLFVFHEIAINFGGLFGALTLGLTFVELYKNRQKRLLSCGIICLLLSCINYFIYQTKIGLPLLAILQKIAFLIFFIWGILLNIDLYQNRKT